MCAQAFTRCVCLLALTTICVLLCRVPIFQSKSDFDTPLTPGEDANFVSRTGFAVPGLLFQGIGTNASEFHRECGLRSCKAACLHHVLPFGLIGLVCDLAHALAAHKRAD